MGRQGVGWEAGGQGGARGPGGRGDRLGRGRANRVIYHWHRTIVFINLGAARGAQSVWPANLKLVLCVGKGQCWWNIMPTPVPFVRLRRDRDRDRDGDKETYR